MPRQIPQNENLCQNNTGMTNVIINITFQYSRLVKISYQVRTTWYQRRFGMICNGNTVIISAISGKNIILIKLNSRCNFDPVITSSLRPVRRKD